MRVVGWNVRSLRDGADGVAAVLRELRPDVAVLQEAPRLWRWRSARRRLARAAGLVVATRGWAAGNCVLVAPHVVVRAQRSVLVPKRRRLHRRGLAMAVLQTDGPRFVAAGTHLDLDPEARADTARRVRAALPDLPVVLCADVNEEDGPAYAALAAELQDRVAGPTFPAATPRRRIDVVLVDEAFEVAAYEVVEATTQSDHRPLCVDLRWR